MPLESYMLVFDLAVRGGNCILLALICGLLLRDHGKKLEARLGALLAVGAAGFSIWSGPNLGVRSHLVMTPILVLSAGSGLVFWLLARALFEDYFRLRPWHVAAWAGIAVIALLTRQLAVAGDVAAASFLARSLSAQVLVFVALAGFQALKSWSDDLLETRRRIRVMVVPAAIAYGALSFATEAIDSLEDLGLLASLVSAVVLALLTFTVAWALLSASGSQEFHAEAPPARSSPISKGDQQLLEQMSETLRSERLYRRQDLSSGHLAAMLEVNEPHLRNLIHRGLGHRSYRSFLDSFRVEEVMAALDDHHQDDVPRLTIARDAGFRSLDQLNRAFRAMTGVSFETFQATRGVRNVETA